MLKFLVGLILGISLMSAVADNLHRLTAETGEFYLNTAYVNALSHGRFAEKILPMQVDKDGYVICSTQSK